MDDFVREDRSIEVSAPDVEEAIMRGLARLGLAREQVEIEIVQQESRGLFGLGAREAIVRLSPLTSATAPRPTVAAPAIAEPALAKAPTTQPPAAPPAAETEPGYSSEPLDQAATDREASSDYDLSEDQISEIARQTLVELLEKMGIECQVVMRHEKGFDDEPAPTALDVQGKDAKVLIGRQGEVLNALQYITRQIVSREVEQWVNLVVDVEQYKQRRARSLQHLAQRIAERVARTKQPVALEPMPPNERRVIHLALHDHPAVTTQSVGKGESRKVTIIPRR